MSRYRVAPADTPELLAQAYEVRHVVYCEETDLATGDDRDEHETRAVHTLLTHEPTRTALGTVRLVLPTDRATLPMAEMTRFCLSRSRVKALGLSKDRSLLKLGLIRGMVALSRLHNIEYLFAFMADALTRTLDSIGIEFEVLGPEISLHGARRAQYCKIAVALERIREISVANAEMILKDSFDFTGVDDATWPSLEEEHIRGGIPKV